MNNPEVQRGLERAGFVPLPFLASTVEVRPDQNAVTLTWDAATGRTYQVEYSPDLDAWFEVPGGELIGSGSTANWTDTGPPETPTPPLSIGERFYRVFQFPSP